MYDENVSCPEVESSFNGSVKGLGVAKKLPSVTTALGNQDRMLNVLSESSGELQNRLQPVLNQSEVPKTTDQELKQSGPAMFETIELNNHRIAELNGVVRLIINQLEI